MIKGFKKVLKEPVYFTPPTVSAKQMAKTVINTLRNIDEEYWQNIRYQTMKDFCAGAKTILSVGCGTREPVLMGATHACDLVSSGLQSLKDAGYKGDFKECPCYDLPFEDKSFDVAVCSEVIEHLYSEEEVKKTIAELDRVAKRWIITTPCKGNPTWMHEPAHFFTFTDEKLKELFDGFECEITRLGEAPRIYYCVIKDENAKRILHSNKSEQDGRAEADAEKPAEVQSGASSNNAGE